MRYCVVLVASLQRGDATVSKLKTYVLVLVMVDFHKGAFAKVAQQIQNYDN